MKAVLIRKYGGPEAWEYAEVPMPKPGPGEVLVRVRAASINPIDWKIRNGMLRWIYPLKMPAILGKDLAGEVVALGTRCHRLRVGDRVFGQAEKSSGSFAEYAVVPEERLTNFSEAIPFEDAAAVPLAASTALQSLRDLGEVSQGSEVMIIGASGGVGSFAVQLGKLLGSRVTAVCSGRNVDFVKGLGADAVVDYTLTDPALIDEKFDLIFDASGHYSFSRFRGRLKPRGRFVSTLPSLAGIFWSLVTSLLPTKKMKIIMLKNRLADLQYLSALVADGSLRPMIERTFPLSELGEASSYSERGHARGKIVISLGGKP